MTMQAIQQILCQIPGEWNETLGHKVGCANCTDNLLMCGKSWCYKAAMNLSIITKDSGSHKSWVDMFLQATQDKECNLKVSESSSPVATLISILDQRVQTKGSPTDKCVQWHCQVLVLALLTSTDVTSLTGQCTNAKKTKPPYMEEFCPCQTIPMTYDQAVQIKNACGPQAAALPARVFLLAVSGKPECMKSSLDSGAKPKMPSQYGKMSLQEDCVKWTQNAVNHHQWFKSLISKAISMQSVPGAPFSIPSIYGPCAKVYCEAFALSIRAAGYEEYNPVIGSSCTWTVGSEGFSYAFAEDVYKVCNAVSAQPIFLNSPDVIGVQICNISTTPIICSEKVSQSSCPGSSINFKDIISYLSPPLTADSFQNACTAYEANATSTAAGAGAAARRLHANDRAIFKPPTGLKKGPVPCTEERVVHSTATAPASVQDMFDALQLHADDDMRDWLPPPPSTEEAHPLSLFSEAEERRLQEEAAADAAASSGGGANDQLLEYTASAWTQCQCYQQCVFGSKSRDVTCKSDKCKSPKPAGIEQCKCTHCADCSVAFNLFGLYLTLFLQGGAGLLLFGCFYFADQVHEDDLAIVSCCSCIGPLGMICKTVPVILRIFVYINMGQVVFLGIQAYIPYLPGMGNFQYDCKTNTPLLILSAVNLTLWGSQFAYGCFMKRNKPMPAPLHVAATGGKLRKLICVPLRSIGP